MREELRKTEAARGTFTGTFVRTGTKRSFGYDKHTVLLTNVQDTAGRVITDHLWFNLTKGFGSVSV